MKIYEIVFDSKLTLKNNKEKKQFMMTNLEKKTRKKFINNKKRISVMPMMNHKWHTLQSMFCFENKH